MKDVALLVPTRSRPDNAQALLDEFNKNSQISDLFFIIDEDQENLYPHYVGAQNVIIEAPRKGMGPALNDAAIFAAYDYPYVAFMGDDHRPRTEGWDSLLAGMIEQMGGGIAYGNDLLQGAALPTAVMMDADIIQMLGYMHPPTLRHLYLDNFWLRLGTDIGKIAYMPEVIIEHMHYANGKAQQDAQYMEVNDPSMYTRDHAAFVKYLETDYPADLEKVRALYEG